MSVDNNTNNEVDNTNNDAGNDANHVLLEDAKNVYDKCPSNDDTGNTLTHRQYDNVPNIECTKDEHIMPMGENALSVDNASLYNNNVSSYNVLNRVNGNIPAHIQHDNMSKHQYTVQEYIANHHTHDGLNDRQVADGQVNVDEQRVNPSFDLIATEQSSDVADVIANTQKNNAVNIQKSHVVAHASTGIKHLDAKKPLPCQDATKATLVPRPILIACDGAGSAPVSDIGAKALCVQLVRLCQSIEPLITSFLDEKSNQDLAEKLNQDLSVLARVIIRHAMGVLQDLSEQHNRAIKDFSSTLNLAIVGTERIFWIKVGDGEIVKQSIVCGADELNDSLSCVGRQSKGEFANQTVFINDKLQFEQDVDYGQLARVDVCGLALMSDGAGEKLIANKRDKVAKIVDKWLNSLRKQQLKHSDIAKAFYSTEFNKNTSGDDCSIALWARELDETGFEQIGDVC